MHGVCRRIPTRSLRELGPSTVTGPALASVLEFAEPVGLRHGAYDHCEPGGSAISSRNSDEILL